MTRQRRLERDPLVAELAPLLARGRCPSSPIRRSATAARSAAAWRMPTPPPSCRRWRWRCGARFRARNGRAASAGSRPTDFFAGLFTTALEPDEMLAEVAIPPLPPRTGWAFQEVARRHGDYAQVGRRGAGDPRRRRPLPRGAAGLPERRRRAGRGPRGGAAAGGRRTSRPRRSRRRRRRRRGDEMDPLGDIHASAAFKRHLARVLTGRVLRHAPAERARTREELMTGTRSSVTVNGQALSSARSSRACCSRTSCATIWP